MATTFLVAVDGSEGAKRAAHFAAARARAEGAQLHLLYVVDWSPYDVLTPRELETRHVERERETAAGRSQVLEPLIAELGDGLELVSEVRHGHAAEQVNLLAKQLPATQVFTGRRGRTQLSAMLFGSVSGNLVQTCPVPLTVVP